jgi:transposase-like protein
MKRRNRPCDPQLQRYWEDVMRRWQKSGQEVRAFCRNEGLHESSFYFWRREVAQRKEQRKEQKGQITKKGKAVSTVKGSVKQRLPQKPQPSFLPVRVVASPENEAAHGGVEIVLVQGRVVRVTPGFDWQTLAEVLSVLEPRPC